MVFQACRRQSTLRSLDRPTVYFIITPTRSESLIPKKESDLQTRKTLLVQMVWKLKEHARRCQTAREAWKPSSLSLWDFDKQHLVTKKRKCDQTLAHDARWDSGAHNVISMVRKTALMSVPYDSSTFSTETRGFAIAHRRNHIQNAT